MGVVSNTPPSFDIHLRRRDGQNHVALLLIKPKCSLDEVCDCLRGHGHSCSTEMVGKKVEAALDPADETLRCICRFMAQRVVSGIRDFGSSWS